MILQFKKLIENSAGFAFEDLKVLRKDRPTRVRLDDNLLQELFLALTDMLETESQEAHERERLKKRRKTIRNPVEPVHPASSASPSGTASIVSSANVSIGAESDSLSTQNSDSSRYPTYFETPQKREFFLEAI